MHFRRRSMHAIAQATQFPSFPFWLFCYFLVLTTIEEKENYYVLLLRDLAQLQVNQSKTLGVIFSFLFAPFPSIRALGTDRKPVTKRRISAEAVESFLRVHICIMTRYISSSFPFSEWGIRSKPDRCLHSGWGQVVLMCVFADHQGQTGPDPTMETLRRGLCPGRFVASGPKKNSLRWRRSQTPQSRLGCTNIYGFRCTVACTNFPLTIYLFIFQVELAMIMDRLYGGVCYAGIDTDPELKYPKGAGRVAFSNQQSYIAAISARFVQLQHGEIDKRVWHSLYQIKIHVFQLKSRFHATLGSDAFKRSSFLFLQVEVKPYVLDDQLCDECQGARCGGKFAPFFCANVTCLQVSCGREKNSGGSSCHGIGRKCVEIYFVTSFPVLAKLC